MIAPWINYREMKEISSRQKYNCQIEPTEEIDDTSQLISPESDFINVLLDKEKGNEISHASHDDFDYELSNSSETKAEDEMNNLFETEDADEIEPAVEQNFEAHDDSDRDLLISSEVEINNLFETEGADEMEPAEEEDFEAHGDSDRDLLISSEVEINNLFETEGAVEIERAEEQDFEAHDDSDRDLLISSEAEINNLFETEGAVEINPSVDQDFTAQQDSEHDFCNPSESNVKNKIKHLNDTEEMENNNYAGDVNAFSESVQGKIYSITQKSPFSTHVEIDDFLHAPICGEVVQNTFEFLDLNNNLIPQFETKLFNTTKDYPEVPDCRLVRSKINEIIFLMRTDPYEKNNPKNNSIKSVVVPLHNTQSIKKGEINNHSCRSNDFMHIRVPVVVGEYKIEICLEDYFVFEKGIEGVKDISNEVVLTNCRFVPNQFSSSLGNGTCTASKGNLFIEGHIHQNIEYTASLTRTPVPAQNKSFIHSNQLCQNIVLELIIHMLQVQKIRVSSDGQGSKGN